MYQGAHGEDRENGNDQIRETALGEVNLVIADRGQCHAGDTDSNHGGR